MTAPPRKRGSIWKVQPNCIKRELQENEPKPALEKEAREVAFRPAAPNERKVRPSQEAEDWSAEVGNPSRHKKAAVCLCSDRSDQIAGVAAEKVAHMIQCHDDHNRAAQKIDRITGIANSFMTAGMECLRAFEKTSGRRAAQIFT